MESNDILHQLADHEKTKEPQFQSLETKNLELADKLEKLRIAARAEINIEREQHKKTFFEMTRLHKQNSELQAKLEQVETNISYGVRDSPQKKGRPASVDTSKGMQRQSIREQSAGQNSGKTRIPRGNKKVEKNNVIKDHKAKGGYHERLSVDVYGHNRSAGLGQRRGQDLSSKSFDYHDIENEENNEIFETFRNTKSKGMVRDSVNESHGVVNPLKAERHRTDGFQPSVTGKKEEEAYRVVREVMRIYGVNKMNDLIPAIRKAEKVINTVPKLQELIKEIADMVIPRVGDLMGKEQAGMKRITAGVKYLCHAWDKKERSGELKRKLASMLTLEEDCKNSEIVRSVEEMKMMLKQFLVGQGRKETRGIDDLVHALESSGQSQGGKSDQNVLHAQFENIKYYLELLKQKLNLDPGTKMEACLNYTVKFVDGVTRDRHAIEILNSVQNVLRCDKDEIIIRVTDLARQKPKHYGPNKYGTGYT